jgi:hypothetical protein
MFCTRGKVKREILINYFPSTYLFAQYVVSQFFFFLTTMYVKLQLGVVRYRIILL